MLKSIHLKNFFSFKDSKIEVNPSENILIGINGSGKSNFLKAIRFLKEGVSGNLKELIYNHWGGFDAMCFNGGTNGNVTTKEIELTFELDHSVLNNFGYEISDNIFYSIAIIKVPNQHNYYLREKLFILKNVPFY